MILPFILIVLLIGAILAPLSAKIHSKLPFFTALASLLIVFGALLLSWKFSYTPQLFKNSNNWMYEYSADWIKPIGASFHLAIDGLSYIMLLLTVVMGIVAVLASTKVERQGFYFFNTLLILAGVAGIFMAMDLLLFFFFWEMMLVPLYFLIAAYSTEENDKAAFKFLLYTQASGLLMLLSILGLFFVKASQTGVYSFDYFQLLNSPLSLKASSLLMFGFVAAFFVKLPVLPVHGWLPSTFKAAPVAGILTGLLIKTGAYGIIRFAIPLFPDASMLFANAAMILGLITIFYGAFIAFSQTDLRLIAAYSSISHMGFIIIGLYSLNQMAWQGAVVQMIASGISTSALIILAEWLRRNTGTCDITKLGRLWENSPILSGLGMFFVMASLGLPGLANFIAEFLILAGTFKVSILISVLASLGVVAAAAYSLRIIQKVFVGDKNYTGSIPEVSWIERISLIILLGILVWVGFNPKPIMQRVQPAIENILSVPPSDIIPAPNNEEEASV